MKKGVAELGFPTNVAMKVTGASRSTLANWLDRGFLVPSIEPSPGTGRNRLYSFVDLVAIRVCNELIAGGASKRSLEAVVRYLRARKGLSASEVLASTVLVAAHGDVYEVEGTMALSALLRPGQRVMSSMVLPLDRLVAEVQAKAALVGRDRTAA